MVSVFFCRMYFINYYTLKVHPCCYKWQDVIHFHGWVIVYTYIYIYICIWCTYTYTYDGHLICFRILAIINNAAVNIEVSDSFWIILHFLGFIPRSRIAGSNGNFTFSVFRKLTLFSIVATPIYIPTNSVLGFSFLHNHINICYLCSFWW